MKVTAYTPKGKVILDLTVAKDIATFGGQESVDYYMRNKKINEKMLVMAEQALIDEGEIEARSIP